VPEIVEADPPKSRLLKQGVPDTMDEVQGVDRLADTVSDTPTEQDRVPGTAASASWSDFLAWSQATSGLARSTRRALPLFGLPTRSRPPRWPTVRRTSTNRLVKSTSSH